MQALCESAGIQVSSPNTLTPVCRSLCSFVSPSAGACPPDSASSTSCPYQSVSGLDRGRMLCRKTDRRPPIAGESPPGGLSCPCLRSSWIRTSQASAGVSRGRGSLSRSLAVFTALHCHRRLLCQNIDCSIWTAMHEVLVES